MSNKVKFDFVNLNCLFLQCDWPRIRTLWLLCCVHLFEFYFQCCGCVFGYLSYLQIGHTRWVPFGFSLESLECGCYVRVLRWRWCPCSNTGRKTRKAYTVYIYQKRRVYWMVEARQRHPVPAGFSFPAKSVSRSLASWSTEIGINGRCHYRCTSTRERKRSKVAFILASVCQDTRSHLIIVRCEK